MATLAPKVITNKFDLEYLVAHGGKTILWNPKTKKCSDREGREVLRTEFKTLAEARTMCGRYNVRVMQ